MSIRFFIVAITAVLLCESSNVPVLLWSNIRIGENALSASLHSISYSQFEQLFINSFPSKNLVIFLQDELSVEDFSGNAGSFKNVHKQVEKHNSMYLPNVENPSFLVNDLPDYGFKVIKINENDSSSWTLESASSNAIVIKLPPTIQSSNRKYPLQKTDDMIRKFLSNLDKVEDFTIMLTAFQPVQSIEAAVKSESIHSIKKRSVPQINKFFQTECALLHVSQNFIYKKDSTSYTLPVDKLRDNAESKCQNNESTIQITYGDLDQLGETNVKFFFGRTYGKKWTINKAEVKSSLNDKPDVLLAPNWLPVMRTNESLVCAAPVIFTALPNQNNGRTTASLRIKAIQVQAFTKGTKKFSAAADCIGFFSLAIWAGLLISLLLVSILSWGFQMIVQLKTMDHFDDPKAKPLVQSTNE